MQCSRGVPQSAAPVAGEEECAAHPAAQHQDTHREVTVFISSAYDIMMDSGLRWPKSISVYSKIPYS